ALWDPPTWRGLALDDPQYAHRGNWIGCKSEILISTLYAIASPVCLWRQSRLDRSELERGVASALFDVWIGEERLATLDPRILYEARKSTDWRRLRDSDPSRYWLQGMKLKDLDELFAEMSNDGQLMSEEAFRQRYLERARSTGNSQRPLGLAANPLQGFELEKRPVFARVMAVHLRVHHALVRLDSAGGIGRMSLEELFALRPESPVRGGIEDPVSLKYLMRKRESKVRPLLWDDSYARLVAAS